MLWVGGFWESWRLYGGDEKGGGEKETKGRETKMMGGIQMHLSSRVNPLVCLFSFHLGHWTQKKGSPVLNLCVCVQAFRGILCVWVACWERRHLQMCAYLQDGQCSPLKARVCMLAQKVTQACAHTHGGILLSHCCLTRGSSVKNIQPPLRASLPFCLKCHSFLSNKLFNLPEFYPS